MEARQDPAVCSYRYAELANKDDIRLIKLLPGKANDRLRMRIIHRTLSNVVQPPETSRGITLKQLRKTLPLNWWVYETLENRIFFYYEEDGGANWKTSWRHPDPKFDHSLYLPRDRQLSTSETLMFEALSYVWGPNTSREAALIENPGSACLSQITLGENLATALRHLRYENTHRVLWVDAICINQLSNEEKDKQVPRMASIYTQASRVIVWLGSETPNSTTAMNMIYSLGNQVEVTTDNWIFSTPGAAEPYWCEASCKLPWGDASWVALNDLLSRRWFGRVWIIQEIQLGQKNAVVQCGNYEMPWPIFRRAIICLWNKSDLSHTLPRDTLGFVEQLCASKLNRTPISLTLRLTKKRGCCNPRDFVYGVLGLFPSTFSARIHPQYSLTEERVYKDLTLQHIDHVKRLELLRDCQLEGRLIHTLPSWVPDYSAASTLPKHAENQFAAGYSRCHTIYLGSDVLEVLGVRCAIVECASPTRMVLENTIDYLEVGGQPSTTAQNSMQVAIAGSSQPYVTGETFQHAFAKTFMGGYLRERFPENNVPSLDDWVSCLADSDFRRKLLRDPKSNDEDSTSQSFVEDHVRDTINPRLYITTREGYLGLAPQGATAGDLICVFLGCDSPILLREVGPGRFSVLGECYVHGLEDARALLGALPPHWKTQVFIESNDHLAEYRFLNVDTNELLDSDPRLPKLSDDEWKLVDGQRTANDPATYQAFEHKTTGKKVRSDPRLTPEVLASRGVLLEGFQLV